MLTPRSPCTTYALSVFPARKDVLWNRNVVHEANSHTKGMGNLKHKQGKAIRLGAGTRNYHKGKAMSQAYCGSLLFAWRAFSVNSTKADEWCTLGGAIARVICSIYGWWMDPWKHKVKKRICHPRKLQRRRMRQKDYPERVNQIAMFKSNWFA